ncbi:unnamed protein product [Closterium sp. Yama58-4]|nr:unnamed protein product [Closterium sp. Yama58-4]
MSVPCSFRNHPVAAWPAFQSARSVPRLVEFLTVESLTSLFHRRTGASGVRAQPSLRWRKALNVSTVFNTAKFGAGTQNTRSGFIGLPYSMSLPYKTPPALPSPLASLDHLTLLTPLSPLASLSPLAPLLTGKAIPGSKGDKGAHGWLDINIYKWNREYNIRFFTSTLGLSRNEVPLSVSIHRGNPKRDGTGDTNMVLSFDSLQAALDASTGYTSTAQSTLTFPWLAVDPTPMQRLRGYKGYGFMQEGTVRKVQGVQIGSTGKSLHRLLDELIKRPGRFYVVVKTPSFPDGAVLGHMQGSLVTKLLH